MATTEQPAGTSMKAFRHHPNDSSSFSLDTLPVPAPGPKDVLIKVHATALTPGELTWPETKLRPTPIPGHDIAGTIAALGAAVDTKHFSIGQKVFALTSFTRDGGAAEYILVHQNEVTRMPAGWGFEEAATVPMGALWVWQALFQHVHVRSGWKVLVTGGGGGVGTLAIQLARHANLFVSTTCSPGQTDLVRSLGATRVFSTPNSSSSSASSIFEGISHDYDLVIDCAGGPTLRHCFALLKGSGKLISVVRPPSDEEKAQRPDVEASFFIVEPDGEELAEISGLCESGVLKGVVRGVLPLEEGAKAFGKERVGDGVGGKVVLKVV